MNGMDAKTGIGLETTYGTPVKSMALLDTLTNNISGTYNRIDSKALGRGRFLPARSVMGSAEIGGSLSCEATPDCFSLLLYAALGAVTTTGAASLYTHAITAAAAGPKPITVATAKGNLIAVASCKVETLTLNAALDAILEADAEMVGIAEKYDQYPETPAGKVFGTASVPISLPFSFTGATLNLDGTANNDCGSFKAVIKNNLSAKRVMGNPFPNAHSAQFAEVTFELDMFYESEALLRKHLGAAAGWPMSRGAIPTPCALTAAFASGTTGHSLTVAATVAYVTAPEPAIEGSDYLKQTVTITVVNPGVTFTLVSAEANTALTTAGTPIVYT
ncbi:MAG TPA: phage tail tube protein [Armatimonadota bacterium]|jgi:hypothetical protein